MVEISPLGYEEIVEQFRKEVEKGREEAADKACETAARYSEISKL
jgi:hypothetical protein